MLGHYSHLTLDKLFNQSTFGFFVRKVTMIKVVVFSDKCENLSI